MRDYSKLRTEFNDIIDKCPNILHKHRFISGIYVIINHITNEFYIGSSANIFARTDGHRRLLRKNIHTNPRLQRSWNKHKEENFSFRLLKLEIEDHLIEIEQMYLDEWNPSLNINPSAEGFRMNHTEETKLKIGKAFAKPINQYDMNGILIKEWESTNQAARSLNIKSSSIHQCLNNISFSSGGFRWSKKDQLPDMRVKIPNSSIIEATFPNGSVKIFNKVKDAAEDIGMHYISISNLLSGKRKNCKKGIKFKYIKKCR